MSLWLGCRYSLICHCSIKLCHVTAGTLDYLIACKNSLNLTINHGTYGKHHPMAWEVVAMICHQGKPSFQQYRLGLLPWVGKIPWRRKWQPAPVPLPGKSHGQRRLVGYSPCGHKELDTTEWLYFWSHILEIIVTSNIIKNFPYVSFQEFYSFKSLIHFLISFCLYGKVRVQLYSFACRYLVSQNQFSKRLSCSPLNSFGTFIENQSGVCVSVYFWSVCSVLLVHVWPTLVITLSSSPQFCSEFWN